jgi:hypothetical protein
MSRAYGYGLLNNKLNTLQSLVLTSGSGSQDLQAVLAEGNTANDIGIKLTSSGIESNHTSTGINFVDNINLAVTNLDKNSLTSFDSVTGKAYALSSDGFNMGGTTGTNLTTMSDGYLNMTTIDASYVGLSPFMLNFNGSQGSEGQVLTKDAVTNNPVWADLPVTEIPDLGTVLDAGAVANQAIDMSDNDITNIANIVTTTQTYFQGQFTFDTPPHIPDPILGNDAAPKGYIDSLVGQYAGGFNLFFNYSQIDPTYIAFKSLSQTVSSSAGQIVDTVLADGNNLIAQFISEPLGVDIIPIGLWDAFIYGAVDSTVGDAHYYFELWKKSALNVDLLLGTSGISPDVNASPNNNPTSYSMTLTISTAINLELTDRIYIILFANKTGGSTTLSTYFEGNYYSFIQTSLNAGTTLLSSNNTWTGTNHFSINPTTPTVVSPAPSDIINYEQVTDLIEPSVTIINYYITQTNPIFQYPPQPPSASIINTYGYYGWQFVNSVASRKIDWFFAPDYDMEVQDVLGLYMNYFNVASTSNDNLPFITIYTKPLGTGDIIPGFAHSSITYIANFTPVANSPYSSFMNISGSQSTPFAYGHQQVGMIQSPVAPNPRGTYLPTMKVLGFAVGTNSASPVNQVNFVMSKVGVCVAGLNNESVLNPFDATQIGTWVGTATSQLNMGSFGITATSSLQLGEPSKSATIQGSVSIPLALTFGSGANTLVAFGGESNNLYDTTTQNNIQTRIDTSGGLREQMYTAIISPTTSGTGALILPLVKSQHYVYIANGSAYNWTIASQTGEFIINGLAGSGIPSTSSITIKPAQTLSFTQLDGGVLGKFNICISEVIQGTSPSFLGATCPTIDTLSALTLGGTTALGTTIGRLTQTTNLLGNVRVNGSSGNSGQVLTSTGTTTAPTWQTPSSGALPTYKNIPTFINNGFAGSAYRAVYDNATFLDVPCPSVTASFLVTGNLSVNSSGVTTNLFGNLGIRTGGGAQTNPAQVVSAFNGALMSAGSNTTFGQTNSLAQCSVSPSNLFGQLSFSIVYTPGAVNTFSYCIWFGTNNGGSGTIHSLVVQQISA